jgi:hypothetical protein
MQAGSFMSIFSEPNCLLDLVLHWIWLSDSCL